MTRGQSAELSPRQRVLLRGLLTEQWQATVARLTALSVRLYETGDGEVGAVPAGQPDTVAALARLRWTLAEIEAALGRMDGAGYGACAACGAPVPFERLESQPHTRYCVRCQPGENG